MVIFGRSPKLRCNFDTNAMYFHFVLVGSIEKMIWSEKYDFSDQIKTPPKNKAPCGSWNINHNIMFSEGCLSICYKSRTNCVLIHHPMCWRKHAYWYDESSHTDEWQAQLAVAKTNMVSTSFGDVVSNCCFEVFFWCQPHVFEIIVFKPMRPEIF